MKTAKPLMAKIGEERLNNQGCSMKIVEMKNNSNIIIEFQDKYKYKTKVTYQQFNNGSVKNPYFPNVYGVGMVGAKYPTSTNNKKTKEYKTWQHILERCYDKKYQERNPSYKNVSCCKEWLSYEDFYEWLHSQENFDKWLNGNKWCLDKDILSKNNKIYSPDTCCLVPENINLLFVNRYTKIKRQNKIRLNMDEILFYFYNNEHNLNVNNLSDIKYVVQDMFEYYSSNDSVTLKKIEREKYIKQVAQEEYNNGNITDKCYQAIMNYPIRLIY